MERFAQDIAADLARTLDARQRELLRRLIRAIVQDAEAEGAGTGIWYIARAIEDRVRGAERPGQEETI